MHGAGLICITGFSCDYQDNFGWKPELKNHSKRNFTKGKVIKNLKMLYYR